MSKKNVKTFKNIEKSSKILNDRKKSVKNIGKRLKIQKTTKKPSKISKKHQNYLITGKKG